MANNIAKTGHLTDKEVSYYKSLYLPGDTIEKFVDLGTASSNASVLYKPVAEGKVIKVDSSGILAELTFFDDGKSRSIYLIPEKNRFQMKIDSRLRSRTEFAGSK